MILNFEGEDRRNEKNVFSNQFTSKEKNRDRDRESYLTTKV